MSRAGKIDDRAWRDIARRCDGRFGAGRGDEAFDIAMAFGAGPIVDGDQAIGQSEMFLVACGAIPIGEVTRFAQSCAVWVDRLVADEAAVGVQFDRGLGVDAEGVARDRREGLVASRAIAFECGVGQRQGTGAEMGFAAGCRRDPQQVRGPSGDRDRKGQGSPTPGQAGGAVVIERDAANPRLPGLLVQFGQSAHRRLTSSAAFDHQ